MRQPQKSVWLLETSVYCSGTYSLNILTRCWDCLCLHLKYSSILNMLQIPIDTVQGSGSTLKYNPFLRSPQHQDKNTITIKITKWYLLAPVTMNSGEIQCSFFSIQIVYIPTALFLQSQHCSFFCKDHSHSLTTLGAVRTFTESLLEV